MEKNEQIEHFLDKAQAVVDQSLNELMEVKMFRENDPSDFSVCQRELQLLREEAENLAQSFPNQQEKLYETKERIKEILEVMVRGDLREED